MSLSRPTAARAVSAAVVALMISIGLAACAPPPPRELSVTPGDGQLTVAFNPVVFETRPAGMVDTTEYQIVVTTDDGFVTIRRATSSPATIGGLVNGRTYKIVVISLGEAGYDSGESEPAYGTPRAAPGPVTGVVATPGNGSATVAFAPGPDGGSAVTGYTVTATDGVHPAITATGTSSPISITGLEQRTGYSVTVTATNAAGTGTPSAPAAVTTYGGPDAPGNVVATPLDGAVAVSFDPPVGDGGSPVTGYTVLVGDGNPSHVFVPVSGTTSPIQVPGLTNGTEYEFAAFAENAFGSGFLSATVTATPTP